ncbi:MAG: ABC transporter substrate binding protein [Casimicrobiaceae bacterium]
MYATAAMHVRKRATWRAAPLRILVACAFAGLFVAAPVAAQHLIVVSTGNSPAEARAIDGIRNHGGWTVDAQRIGDDDAALASILSQASRGTVVVALGARAAEFVSRLRVSAPTVDCMVQGDLRFASAAPVVPLAVPIDVHIKWMKQLIPAVRKVALLYDPAQNERTAAEMTQRLAAAGYTVMAEQVGSPQALPPALAKLASADALLALPDTTVYSPELAKGLLLFTYRTDTPMIAFSDAWVRAGALYSLEWDYGEMGAYCGELALHLGSTDRNAVPPALPAPHVSVNRRAAAQLRLKWDAASLAGVDQIHE